MWTRFMDMHSGGGLKEKWACIYIEAPEEEAKVVFFNRFGHNPERVSCTCCGDDYSISSHESLAQLSGHDRNCRAIATPRVDGLYKNPDDPWFDAHYWLEPDDEGEAERRGYRVEGKAYSQRPHVPLAEYCQRPDVLVIRADEIKPAERTGDVPRQGFVWVD